jgi:ribosomal protein S18 acetylase RimI-like enzyme
MKLRWAVGCFLKRPREALRGPQAQRKYPTTHLFRLGRDRKKTMNIVKAEKKDLTKILELQKICFRDAAVQCNDFNIPPMKQTLEQLEQEFETILILKAQSNDEIIGSARAYEKNRTCYIARVIVHPESQNKGIGKSLMKAIEEHFPKVMRYELFTGYKDEKNIYFYKSLGYVPYKEEDLNERVRFVFLEKKNKILKDGFVAMDFDRIADMLKDAFWCKGIKKSEILQGAKSSALLVGAFTAENMQVGYSRVISDKTRFAYVLDVIVDENYRKQGIGQAMMRHIINHPELKDVYQWLLITKDAHGVYKKVGFNPVARPEDWMEIRHQRPER